jgi:hypothetical protein
MSILSKAAVFVRGTRKYRDVTVDVTPTEIIVTNFVTGQPIETFTIDETVKFGMAWDVTSADSTEPFRLVAQEGCGCGGQKPYEPDATYSGKILF